MSVTSFVSKRLKAFGRDDIGSVMPFFAFSIGAIAVATGATIEYARFSGQRALVQKAMDEAVLSAAHMGDADTSRTARAKAYFDSRIRGELETALSNEAFSTDAEMSNITGRVSLTYHGAFSKLTNVTTMTSEISATAVIAKPTVRELDLVMCIDGTGSMGNTLAAVKSNALNFEANLNAEIVRRGIAPFEAMRVRVVYFRDYAGSFNGTKGVNGRVLEGGRWINERLYPGDPNYWSVAGDVPPLKTSSFFSLPADRGSFSSFVAPETATGGGDLPEAGLECVNEAMNSSWTKLGTPVGSAGKPLDALFPVIVVWTDAAAHAAGYYPSLMNPAYPSAETMPRTTAALRAKWMSSGVIDQGHKLLVFFGNPRVSQSDYVGPALGWADVATWPGFVVGGTLTQGNQQMVTRIADAIATRISSPFLSH